MSSNKQVIEDPSLPARKLRSTYHNWWQRWFFRHPKAKKAGIASMSLLFIVAGLLLTRFILTANQIIVGGGGAAALQEDVDPNLLRGEGDGRINILLIGVGGARHTAGDLADSIMIISIDPISRDVAMVSIPRDLYVPIPGYGSAKINAAHAYGEQYKYPGGGPKLLSETISQNLGIPIHYFIRVDFEGFKQAINTVGGIDLDVKQAIYDPAYPDANLRGYDPFSLSAGLHHFDGNLALKYARSRYSTNDFDRGHRQQLLLKAFKDKALGISTLINPVRLNSLLATAGSHAKTNIQISEGLKMIDIAKQVLPTQVTQAALTNDPKNYLASQTINGASVLVPKTGNFAAIRYYLRNLMLDGFLKREAATITVLNGTGQPGLADETARILRSYGYKVIKVGNASKHNYAETQIYDYSNGNKRYTLHYLQRRFGVTASQRPPLVNGADITIVVGADYTPVE